MVWGASRQVALLLPLVKTCLLRGLGKLSSQALSKQSALKIRGLGLPCRQLSANIFVCERCGAANFCGDACTERLLDRSSELPVCPISGRCFSRMIFPWEVTPLAHLYSDTLCTPLLRHPLHTSAGCLLPVSMPVAGLPVGCAMHLMLSRRCRAACAIQWQPLLLSAWWSPERCTPELHVRP